MEGDLNEFYILSGTIMSQVQYQVADGIKMTTYFSAVVCLLTTSGPVLEAMRTPFLKPSCPNKSW